MTTQQINALPPGPVKDGLLKAQEKPAKVSAPIRARRGVMNKWERSFADEVLEPMKRAGEIAEWRFESVKLIAGVGSYYTPDFYTRKPDGAIVFYEVKGQRREAGVKAFKAAALLWPCFGFVFVTRHNRTNAWQQSPIV